MGEYHRIAKIMNERFGQNELIGLATKNGDKIANRIVCAYYENESFYVITYSLSDKMKQITIEPNIAICTLDWFTGNGLGENLGWVCDERNTVLMEKLRAVFSSWYSTCGHVDESDHNTCILRIRLSDGLLIEHKGNMKIYNHIDFNNKKIV
ncbi:TPA: hypothetical protein R1887_005313 [Klebsiella oxytoca]|nr:hypothetical protein [Klebsiella michiganensis]HEC2122699.1 hypothetical protein [Klebsiella oxytoca]